MTGRPTRAIVALALSVLLTEMNASAAEAPAPSQAGLDRITAFFDNEVAGGKIPGAVVVIQQHGQTVYLKTFGVRDVAAKAPMTQPSKADDTAQPDSESRGASASPRGMMKLWSMADTAPLITAVS